MKKNYETVEFKIVYLKDDICTASTIVVGANVVFNDDDYESGWW